MDREKVIEGLKELQSYFRAMAGIASSEEGQANHIESARIIEDALALLKAREPVEPTWRRGLAFCGKCGRQFGRGFKYCPDCGRAVKWE